MVTTTDIRKKSRLLTEEHARALLEFKEKEFKDAEGVTIVKYFRSTKNESQANPFVIIKMIKIPTQGIVYKDANVFELLLIADGLIKKE